MNISLAAITKDNWEEAIELKVKEDQRSFMASNLYSIAESKFLDNFYTFGIYLEKQMVGFCMFGIDPDDGNYWVYRLMIDENHQGNGLGTQSVRLIIEHIRKHHSNNIPLIMIGYHPNNIGAKFTYKKAGFTETEIAPWGEQLAQFTL
ncbi:GNAT family N-acetyltransferase [Litchfieldia alkalitelluris]|uniref:GNAT family N-acetyltransferase n=1 Tax=Litchfieldia alkalitelluris TaxID=304268 RepID=UPI000996B0F5|nr:GNAT family N-acetyltransferase [Litchfieldia alkalitelluris]